jgi:hypothetical protein
MGRSRNRYECFGEEKNVLPLPEIEILFLIRPIRSVFQGGNTPQLLREYRISIRKNRVLVENEEGMLQSPVC